MCVCLLKVINAVSTDFFVCFKKKSRCRRRADLKKDFVTTGPSAKLGQRNYLCTTDHTPPTCTNGTRPVRSCRLAFVTSFPCVQTAGGVVSGPLGVSGRRSRSRQAERQIICLPQNARCVLSTGSATGSRRGSPVEGELSAEIAEH